MPWQQGRPAGPWALRPGARPGDGGKGLSPSAWNLLDHIQNTVSTFRNPSAGRCWQAGAGLVKGPEDAQGAGSLSL